MENDNNTKNKNVNFLYKLFVQKPSHALQRRPIFYILIIIGILLIVNIILFIYDDYYNDPTTSNFNRNVTADGKHASNWFTDSCYFTLSSFSTIGYGDITPKTTLAKSWCCIMQFITLAVSLKLFEYIYDVESSSVKTLNNEISRLNEVNSSLIIQNSDLINKLDTNIINANNRPQRRGSITEQVAKTVADATQILTRRKGMTNTRVAVDAAPPINNN